MIDLMLQQLRKTLLVACGNHIENSSFGNVLHRYPAMTLHLHEDGEKAEASVPDNNLLFTLLKNHRVDQTPRLLTRQVKENHSLHDADLRRSNRSSVAGSCTPVRQRVGQVSNEFIDLGREDVL